MFVKDFAYGFMNFFRGLFVFGAVQVVPFCYQAFLTYCAQVAGYTITFKKAVVLEW